MNKLTLEDVEDCDYKNKSVLLRVDFNVPLHKTTNAITDDSRIKMTLPTIKYVLERDPKCLIITSHLGRPTGGHQSKFSLRTVARRLGELLGRNDVIFVGDCISENVLKIRNQCKNGTIVFLENVRFYKEEEGEKTSKEKVAKFRKKLSSFADIFISDAFAVSHRAHSSVVGVSSPVKAAGYLMKKEMDYFGKVLKNPEKPFLAILGGAKVDTKIGVINNLLNKVDEMIIFGGMAYTFMNVIHGMKIGRSIFDKEGAKLVRGIVALAKEKGVTLHFPVDWLAGDDFSDRAYVKKCSLKEGIPDDFEGLDIGEKSIENFSKVIARAKTIIWNGPPGVFELQKFSNGSMKILDALVKAGEKGAITIVGGGDSASLVNQHHLKEKFSHVSTGGGASLELCEGKKLPGFDALNNKKFDYKGLGKKIFGFFEKNGIMILAGACILTAIYKKRLW